MVAYDQTPVKYLPVLSGIAPSALRREHHTSTLIKKALSTKHLSSPFTCPHCNSPKPRPPTPTLRSRRPFSRQAASLANSNFNLMEQWKHDWQETIVKPVQLTITPGTNIPPGADLPRREWVTLNRLRTGVGRFGANMYRWGLRPSAACLSGAPKARTSFGLPHWPEQPVPLNRGLLAAAPWSSIAAGLIRKKICKSLGIVMPRITIGFPGQIRKFDNQIHFNFIQIRQFLSCRENYHSYSFSYHSI